MNSKYAINILQSSATITRLLEVFFCRVLQHETL